MNLLRRIRTAFTDEPAVTFCDSCARVSVCDTGCRVAAARDRALTTYLNLPAR